MKKLLLAAALMIGFSASAYADGMMMVKDVWSRASAGPARAGAAFMMIHNMGMDDKLVGAKANVSSRVELHTHRHEDGVMRMREVASIDIPKGEEVFLKPGSFHVMFMGLNAPFKEGETFPLTLVFEKAGDVTVEVEILSAGAMGKSDHMDEHMKHGEHGHHGHDDHKGHKH